MERLKEEIPIELIYLSKYPYIANSVIIFVLIFSITYGLIFMNFPDIVLRIASISLMILIPPLSIAGLFSSGRAKVFRNGVVPASRPVSALTYLRTYFIPYNSIKSIGVVPRTYGEPSEQQEDFKISGESDFASNYYFLMVDGSIAPCINQDVNDPELNQILAKMLKLNASKADINMLRSIGGKDRITLKDFLSHPDNPKKKRRTFKP